MQSEKWLTNPQKQMCRRTEFEALTAFVLISTRRMPSSLSTGDGGPHRVYAMKLSKIALAVLLLLCSAGVNAAELVKLKTRPGVNQKFILIKPQKPVASVILFAGGKGTLNLSSSFGFPSINSRQNNFLVRTRNIFAKNSLMVAVVDAPSDQNSKTGLLGGFRDSMEHVADIDHVIGYLRQMADIPVWLIGTSRGTESAANIAINSEQHPDGLVLTSSMSVPNANGTSVTDMDLKAITIPTLIVANTDDQCRYTPPEGAKEIAGMLTSSKKVAVKLFGGGDTPISKPCRALSYHGFLGIEIAVVNFISDFIKSN